MSDWRPIRELPDDFSRTGGQRTVLVRDLYGKEWIARRVHLSNSGWLEVGTNREIWPIEFDRSSEARGIAHIDAALADGLTERQG